MVKRKQITTKAFFQRTYLPRFSATFLSIGITSAPLIERYCPSGAILTLILPASVVAWRLSPYSRSPRYTVLLGFDFTFCSQVAQKTREMVHLLLLYFAGGCRIYNAVHDC